MNHPPAFLAALWTLGESGGSEQHLIKGDENRGVTDLDLIPARKTHPAIINSDSTVSPWLLR